MFLALFQTSRMPGILLYCYEEWFCKPIRTCSAHLATSCFAHEPPLVTLQEFNSVTLPPHWLEARAVVIFGATFHVLLGNFQIPTTQTEPHCRT